DFDFVNGDTSVYKSTMTYKNWGWAATNVTVWNAVITLTLAVPIAAFYESFNHEGVYDPATDSWVWSYNFNAGGIYLAELHASLVAGGVKWEMYISKNNTYNDFLWYSGITNLNNTAATWELNHKPEDPTPFVLIEWERDIQNENANIKYTNVIPNGSENGGYITYGIENDSILDAFYQIYNKGQDNITDIKWNRTTKNGQVRDEKHFGDFEWKCWDENLMDIICP
ncbi:MAG: hypothetical protein B6D61_05745, partial [Bacteroidetes bacterium 4484_249]